MQPSTKLFLSVLSITITNFASLKTDKLKKKSLSGNQNQETPLKANSQQPTANSQQPTANSQQPTANSV